MLHGQRFKLQESLRKLQDCMNLLEKERAWEEHVSELSDLVQRHQAVVQVTRCKANLAQFDKVSLLHSTCQALAALACSLASSMG